MARRRGLLARGPVRAATERAARAWAWRWPSPLLDRARDRGCARVELDVNESNGPARALYEGLGFTSAAAPGAPRNLLDEAGSLH